MKIAISAGHGSKVSGAVGPKPWGLNEYAENVKVMNKTVEFLKAAGVEVQSFTDTVSTTQDQNLHRLVNWHNDIAFGGGKHDLDISIHFNCNVPTSSPVGTECLWVTQENLAEIVSHAIHVSSGLIDRGAKYRDGLYFLNNTREKSILVETCFVDSHADVDIYHQHFNDICQAIAMVVGGGTQPAPEPTPPETALLHVRGPCSWFGGPKDDGVDADEGLAFIYEFDQAPHLFLPKQPPNTTGLARRLDPGVMYVACRWDYARTPKDMLQDQTRKALVRAKGFEVLAYPADWGPHEQTARVADLSPALMETLGLHTDDEVEILYPAPQNGG